MTPSFEGNVPQTLHPTVTPSGISYDFYQLVVATDPGPNAVELNSPDDVYRNIVYDVDGGTEVTAPYRPAYRADHTYRFVLDLQSQTALPSILRLGVNDGVYVDNSGSYQLEVTQLAPAVVPLPRSALAGGALMALLIVHRAARSRKSLELTR